MGSPAPPDLNHGGGDVAAPTVSTKIIETKEHIMLNANRGYVGYSMSVRAYDAYENGEKPWSKWTKALLLEALEAEGVDVSQLADVDAEVLRREFLIDSSWHHTSSYFNATSFYSVKSDPEFSVAELLAESERVRAERRVKRDERRMVPVEKAYIEYGEWTGTRNHPRLVTRRAYALVRGGWAWLEDGSRKSLAGKHCSVVERYGRAPRGTATTFAAIARNMK